VAFFLYGGTALAEGRGEIVTPLPPPSRMWTVLVVPHVPVTPQKTAQLYASLKASHYTDGRITQKLAAALKAGDELTPSALFNTFENVAFNKFSELSVYQKHLMKMGAARIHLAGSGPTLFTLTRDRTQAEELHIRCQQQGMESYLVDTSPPVDWGK
jgi:4-diphosphocytidyl-2-C-methyl-D-erythritol kinase